MANETRWRHMSLASPAEHYWRSHAIPGKGEYGGHCHHLTCANAGADWYNRSSGRYYCDACAREINTLCLAQGMPKLCQLHI
jgi:hypothetical protein